jgi:hypothetical protein
VHLRPAILAHPLSQAVTDNNAVSVGAPLPT